MKKSNWFEVCARGETGRAEIYIYGPIVGVKWHEDEVGAKDFIDQLKPLGDVDLHINSSGGNVATGSAIYNALKRHPGTVDVYIDGVALSMASVVAMAGRRIIMPKNATMMIHDPALELFGNATAMRKAADVLEKFKVGLVAAYQEKTGLAAGKIEQLMAEETWMTAEEAVNLGFATDLGDPVQIAASFDLSHFKNVPQAMFSAHSALLDGTCQETIPDALARMSKEAFKARA